MKTNSNFFVYVQALGGKFLGPNAYQPGDIKVVLKTADGEHKLPYYEAGLTDGDLPSSAYAYMESSFLPILTFNPLTDVAPTVNYLTPNDSTVVAHGYIALPEQTTVAELTVEVPRPTDSCIILNQQVLLNRNQAVYDLTVVVPGLLIKSVAVDGSKVQATVTMMCGCEIKEAFFWIPSDFEVYAWVSYKQSPPRRFPLIFDETTDASVFIGDIQDFDDPVSILFTARQLSTGNYGLREHAMG